MKGGAEAGSEDLVYHSEERIISFTPEERGTTK